MLPSSTLGNGDITETNHEDGIFSIFGHTVSLYSWARITKTTVIYISI